MRKLSLKLLGLSLAVILYSLIGVFTWAAPASASLYGRGNYSACKYQTDCPTDTTTSTPGGTAISPTPPVVPPSTDGSTVVIKTNIEDGQLIDKDTVQIVTTKLEKVNADGTTTDIPLSDVGWVSFYVDQKIVTTQYDRDPDGTFHINWEVSKNPGTQISLAYFDHAGQIIQRLDRTVRLSAALLQPSTLSNNGSSAGNTSGGGKISATHKRITLTPRQEQIVKSLPYWILLILIAIALRLWLQSVREVRASDRIRAIIKHEKDIYNQKQNFVALVSHYLRTPITQLEGGIELLSAATASLQDTYKSVHQTVEAVIADIDKNQTSPLVLMADTQTLEKRPLRLLPFWVLIASMVLVILIFEVLSLAFTTISYSWFDILVELLCGAGAIIFLLLAARQSQLKRSEREHQAHALQIQYSLNDSRNQFIANAANSLRTVLQQALPIFRQFANDATAGKFIRRATTDLQQTIARLDVAAKISANAFSPASCSSIVINDLITQTVAKQQPKIDEKRLAVSTPHSTFSAVNNPAMLNFLLDSTIENAVKFSDPAGKIAINASIEAGTMAIAVTDDGIGIPQEKLSDLFQPFSRTDGAEDFTYEGMGFDLYLCKLITDQMNGSIDLQSPGSGSGAVATLRIPVSVAS